MARHILLWHPLAKKSRTPQDNKLSPYTRKVGKQQKEKRWGKRMKNGNRVKEL
jgi:hypothetical protein